MQEALLKIDFSYFSKNHSPGRLKFKLVICILVVTLLQNIQKNYRMKRRIRQIHILHGRLIYS